MIETEFDVATADGAMATFLCRPAGPGPWPLVLYLMDAPGIREELRDMARRLADAGYAVALPDLYYRHGRGISLDRRKFADPASGEKERMLALLRSLRQDMVLADLGSLVDALTDDDAVDVGRAAVVGYCMSGRFALFAAVAWPQRIRAVASFFGTRLVTDGADSPHLALPRLECPAYFAFAEIDEYVPGDMRAAFERAAAGSGTDTRCELYPGTHHGFSFPQSPAYDRTAAERHWTRLRDLFDRTLGGT
ncbi:MAG: dienelactone hydrolase family protein [Hyphomicrobiales bacterium]|nr:dienelactone hydrolase family protein [Hyphomicrobiales bacterium]MCP5372188.1 dienelactone hydrolase family protein [Hyphomicrobiales bacterium]